MSDDSNVIAVEFSLPKEVAFRSHMVDVLKRYFAHSTLEGCPNALTVEIILCSLCQAIEEDGLDPRIFDQALKAFAQRRYGYRVLTASEFDQLRRDIEADLSRSIC